MLDVDDEDVIAGVNWRRFFRAEQDKKGVGSGGGGGGGRIESALKKDEDEEKEKEEKKKQKKKRRRRRGWGKTGQDGKGRGGGEWWEVGKGRAVDGKDGRAAARIGAAVLLGDSGHSRASQVLLGKLYVAA